MPLHDWAQDVIEQHLAFVPAEYAVNVETQLKSEPFAVAGRDSRFVSEAGQLLGSGMRSTLRSNSAELE